MTAQQSAHFGLRRIALRLQNCDAQIDSTKLDTPSYWIWVLSMSNAAP